jgi:general secretion pathway protein J
MAQFSTTRQRADVPTGLQAGLRTSLNGGFSARWNAGFTLIEVLVAIFIMSLLALASWQGIDGMSRAQNANSERADQIATLQTALSQWQSDLDHMQFTSVLSPIDYNGQVLRITRSYGKHDLRVVGWTQRGVGGQIQWLRWESEPINSRAKLLETWVQVARWAMNPNEQDRQHEVVAATIDNWQIYYNQGNAWVNPQSQNSGVPPANGALAGAAPIIGPPDGVRLVLQLSQGQALAGSITRDWAQPNLK